jgi:spore coat polysaccharide biosynthesis protein SpsF (cytidylyltransferase family)
MGKNGITVIDSVIQACRGVVTFINRESHKTDLKAFSVILIPFGDPLSQSLMRSQLIVEGDKDDLISRYQKANAEYMPDYIVRITGDCPLAVQPLITRCIKMAIKDSKDYVSNVWEGLRTFEDGLDVEVFTPKVLDWLDRNATEKADREHVTTLFRRETPDWASVGSVVGYINREHVKLSVDTEDDLTACIKNRDDINQKIELAKKYNHSVYRF